MAKNRLLGQGLKDSLQELKNFYNEYSQELDESEELDEQCEESKKTFEDKFKDFARKHKKLSFGLLAFVAIAPNVAWDAYRVYNKINFTNEIMKQSETYSGSGIETVTERPTVDENGYVIRKDNEQEKQGVTIESGDYIFSQDANGEYSLKEKSEADTFKQDLQGDVKKEEDLTQEELEQRAQESQEKAEITPEIEKTLE